MNLETLAVMFRVNDPNLAHVDVWNAMSEAGLAYTYGLFRAIPRHHRRKRQQMANSIADELSRKAKAR